MMIASIGAACLIDMQSVPVDSNTMLIEKDYLHNFGNLTNLRGLL